jgi:hypothetical protein
LTREEAAMERRAAANSSSSSARPSPPPPPRPGLGEGVAWSASHIRRGPECAHSGGDDALLPLLRLAPPPSPRLVPRLPLAPPRARRVTSCEQLAAVVLATVVAPAPVALAPVALAPSQPAAALGGSGTSTHSVTLTAASVRCQPGHAAYWKALGGMVPFRGSRSSSCGETWIGVGVG